MINDRTLVTRCFTLLSLLELVNQVELPELLTYMRSRRYLNFSVSRAEMKQTLDWLISSHCVYQNGSHYGILRPGQEYLCELRYRLDGVELTPAGRRQLELYARTKGCRPQASRPSSSVTPSRTGSTLADVIAPESGPAAMFGLGAKVMVRNRLRERGIVIKRMMLNPGGWHYEVYFSATDIRVLSEADLVAATAGPVLVGLEGLLRNLALVKLRSSLSDNLYALYASRTQFEVYQFRPALKFLDSSDQRLLIADEVGLGKTIEAAIIYLELHARLDLNRVLVVCPSSLRQKWQDELRLRFDEEFMILDSAGVRRFIDRYEQTDGRERLRGIVSLELLRRPEFAGRFEELPMHFDLVIVDEAHHCRNRGTQSNNLATVLSENADAMLLLTATPLQIGNEDLFNLLQILLPGEFSNLEVFLDRLEPNQYVNRAAQILATGKHKVALAELRKVESTRHSQRFLGNPYYGEVVRALATDRLGDDELVSAQRRLVDLNTLANVFTRTRKREIGENVPTRSAFTLTVQFTPAEALFYNKIIRHVREEFAAVHGRNFLSGWVSIMRERQVASCISAARRRFGELAREGTLTADDQGFLDPAVVGEWEEQDLSDEGSIRSRWYQDMSGDATNQRTDSKLEVFLQTLHEVLAEDESSKVIVFSYFRHTIEYLYERLARLGIGTSYMHGGIKVDDRAAVIDAFRQQPEIRVLISSDVGAEGLDFQFCNTIFNYDLPWNPMKVEQRIGRIDRFGQKSPKVRIYNLVIDNSIESRILVRLYERIGLFERAVGDIEAILGEEIRELSRRVYTSALSPDEEARLADQAAQNIVRRQQEMEEFEQRRLQFMGQDAIFSTRVNRTVESGNYVSEVEVRALVESFVRDVFKRAHLEMNSPFDGTFALEMDDELDAYLRRFILGRRAYNGWGREFLQRIGSDAVLPVTFSSEMASERKLLNFITSRHPLALAAADYWAEQGDPANSVAYLGLRSDTLRPGTYFFFIFYLEAKGAEHVQRLVPVAVAAESGDVYFDLSRQLLRLIQTTAYDSNRPSPEATIAQLASAEHVAMEYMIGRRDSMKEEILRLNEAQVNARLTNVTQTYEAMRRRVEQAMMKTGEARIQRMYRGRLRNLRADQDMKMAEIERQREVTLSFSLVLRGRATVTDG